MLVKNPGVTVVAVLAIALGIGANTTIFSAVDAVFIRPLPYPDPQQLVGLGQWRTQKNLGYVQTGVSPPNALDLDKQAKSLQRIGWYRWTSFNLTRGNPPERVVSVKVSASMLSMLGIQPALGRVFTPEDAQPGHAQVAILGYAFWQTHFASNPRIIGRTIELDEKPYTVVGVMPARFRFIWDQPVKVLVPLAFGPSDLSAAARSSRNLETIGRLNPGVTPAEAQAEMDAIAHRLEAAYPEANKDWGLKVEPLHAAYHRQLLEPFMVLLGAVALVLLICCVNVANLLLARATARRREISIRLAIGASRGRLMRQLLTESILLGLAGGVLGLLLAYWGVSLLRSASLHYFEVIGIEGMSLDLPVLLFTLGITLLTGVTFGLAPAIHTSKSGLVESLKQGGLSTTADPGRRRLGNSLVASEIALAMVLMVGAGLLIRSFVRLLNVNLGFRPEHVLTAAVILPEYKYPKEDQQAAFFEQVIEKTKALPGVESAAATTVLPLWDQGRTILFVPEGQPRPAPGQEPTAYYQVTSPDYFRTIQATVAEGRYFTDADAAASPPVAIVSETLARRYWPHSDPLGSHLDVLSQVYGTEKPGEIQPLEIVGVVKDIKEYPVWEDLPQVYVPLRQHPSAYLSLVLRTGPPPMNLVPALRNAVLEVDREQPLDRIRTMDEIVDRVFGFIRFPMTLVWIFAGMALLLAAVGIFGVMAYSVSQRTQEVAIRMALGAGSREVLKLVVGESLRVTLAGVGAGLILALGLGRVIASYLYGVRPVDPLTFAAVALLLGAVAVLASYLPARRAARVNPMVSLRHE